jgi:hypothetical protein
MLRQCRLVYAACAVLLFASTAMRAQQSPFKPPSNLQVLPKDTRLAEIVPMMRGFTRGLGVRCQFCHSYTGTDPNALESFDFPGDTIPEKQIARKMMAMTDKLNADLTTALGLPANGPRVTCFTCHRGERKPKGQVPAYPA